MRRGFRSLLVALTALFLAHAAVAAPATPAYAATPFVRPALAAIPAAAGFDSSGHLDPEAATRAYLDLVPADKRASSNKYFEGGYWLLLWDALLTVAISLLLLFSGFSARLRDRAERVTRFRWIHTWIYFAAFVLVSTVLSAPLTWYEGFYREHIYNQSHSGYGVWLHDQLVGLLITVLLGGLFVACLYALVRRLPNTWHLWGTAVTVLFIILTAMIAPVYLAPLFNTYTTIQDADVTGPVLRMAHANGIEVNKLFEVDASRQTTQVSANVSGLFGTTRITLNDNLLRTASLPEIEAVTGHEMGHYVLNHVAKSVVSSVLQVFLFFTILRAWLGSMQRRWAPRWGTRAIDDVALLPAAVLAISVISLLFTPIDKTLTRTQEYEADMYGINASRQPDGFAQSMLKLGQYRKLDPTPLEEFLFYDHPSGHTRIRAAMRWKSQNAEAVKACAGYP
ncbi:MAG TPA: M48 family metallopeptidase [Acidobacteriaceae bacterium]